MSHSTTATTTYNLVKYSRSYAQTNGGSEQGEQEWQHFTNPVIRLVVDVKKSTSGELESFRTRILWSLNQGQDGMDVDQREVIFEDLDLLTFSSTYQDRTSAPQGLPLKAVYRDTVIGIRYLHPRVIPAGAIASYRRFQITFQSAAFAASFIDSIKFICPCKANPMPPPGRNMARATTMMQPVGGAPSVGGYASQNGHGLQHTGSSMRIQSGNPASVASSQLSFTDSTPFQPPETPPRAPVAISSPWFSVPTLGDRPSGRSTPNQMQPFAPHGFPGYPPPLTSVQVPRWEQSDSTHRPLVDHQSAVSGHSSGIATSDDTYRSRPSSAITASSAVAEYSAYAQSDSSQTGTKVPERALPAQTSGSAKLSDRGNLSGSNSEPAFTLSGTGTLESASITTTQQLAEAKTDTVIASQSLMSCLEQTSSLYNMPRTELEGLVAKVVREEGFAKLLEELDSMWRIKGFMGRTSFM